MYNINLKHVQTSTYHAVITKDHYTFFKSNFKYCNNFHNHIDWLSFRHGYLFYLSYRLCYLHLFSRTPCCNSSSSSKAISQIYSSFFHHCQPNHYSKTLVISLHIHWNTWFPSFTTSFTYLRTLLQALKWSSIGDCANMERKWIANVKSSLDTHRYNMLPIKIL